MGLGSVAHAQTITPQRKPIVLTSNTLQQISALQAEKAARTPAQQRISSRLLYAAKIKRGQPIAAGVQSLKTHISEDAAGLVLVDINAEVTNNVVAAINSLGGKIVNSHPEYNAIRASVPLLSLEQLASVAGVKYIGPAAEAHLVTRGGATNNPNAPQQRWVSSYFQPVAAGKTAASTKAAVLRSKLQAALPAFYNSPAFSPLPGVGSVDTEGNKTHRADLARTTFGVNGSGIKIGVISDSDDGLEASQANGNLGTVTVLAGQDGRPGTGEGTAMLEIVHDIAPGSPLYFASAFGGEAQFANNIIALFNAGCRVIIDDVGYFDESPFQDGVIAQAVAYVTTHGALYFSSAGNSGNLDGKMGAAWEGDFVDSGVVAAGDANNGKAASFGNSGGHPITSNIVSDGSGAGQYAWLFWADKAGGAANDYDLYEVDDAGDVVDSSTNTQNGTQDPNESIRGVLDGDGLVVALYSGSPRFLHLALETDFGLLNVATVGHTAGHATVNTPGAYGVAAAPASVGFDGTINGPYPNPFSTTSKVEAFSSDGPRRQFFLADGTAITPGNFSSSGGIVLNKPDITAADGVTTSLSHFDPFFGTSAAAPHAGALAALLLSKAPALTPEQVRPLIIGSAIDIMQPGYDPESGYGIMDAVNLLSALAAPTISGFTPATGPVGTVVTITGTALTGVTSVKFNTTAATSITPVSSTSLKATVPAGATTGPISVTSSQGTATSTSNFTVTTSQPATISGFTPASGPVGTVVTISGTNLTNASAVSFNGKAATSFTPLSAISVKATVPAGATTGKITVVTPQGTATSAASFTLATTQPATITSFTPVKGPVGTAVVITGTSLTGATAVKFNGKAATTFTVTSATSVKATVPAGATSGKITIVAPAGTAISTATYTVTTPPTVTSFTPTSGPAGTVVAIAGTFLTGATSITFNGKAATTITPVSATSVKATVPAGATTGKITVTTSQGSATSAANFTVTIPKPTITSFTPASGPVGKLITITGTVFTGATYVKFNGTASKAVTVKSATSITATVPAGATTGKITITTPAGVATSATNFTVTASAPTVTSFTPTSSPVGKLITITGTSFTGATAVKFNGTASPTISVKSATSITAVVPNGATTGKISVTTPAGTGLSAGNFTVTPSAPAITAFSPASGKVGSVVSISGTNFTGVTVVKFNGTAAKTVTFNSATKITATVPVGATTGKITLTYSGGTASSATSFTVLP